MFVCCSHASLREELLAPPTWLYPGCPSSGKISSVPSCSLSPQVKAEYTLYALHIKVFF